MTQEGDTEMKDITPHNRSLLEKLEEVCAAAHEDVEECGYCQRDRLAARCAQLEAALSDAVARTADLLVKGDDPGLQNQVHLAMAAACFWALRWCFMPLYCALAILFWYFLRLPST